MYSAYLYRLISIPLIGYRSINLLITIKERSTTTVSREGARSAVRSTVAKFVTIWSIPFISGSDETKGVAHGWKLRDEPRVRAWPNSRTSTWQRAHRFITVDLYPHQISSHRRRSCVPSYVIPALRQLIYLWAGISFLRPRTFPLPRSPTLRSSSTPPARNNQILHTRDTGRTRPNFFLATLRKNCAGANTHRPIILYIIYILNPSA